MQTVPLTAATFGDVVTENAIVLVDWWASWCGPCLRFAPIFEAAAGAHPDILFGKVDTEAEQQLAGEAGISSIPTIMAFRDGILVFSQPGAMPGEMLDELIRQVRALDMDEVRRDLTEQGLD